MLINDATEQHGKPLGLKYNLSNCMEKIPKRHARDSAYDQLLGGYDVLKLGFSACDRFNRDMHEKSYPFRCGGGHSTGNAKCEHNFTMTCVLLNTYNAYIDIHEFAVDGRPSFRGVLEVLADELYLYSLSLHDDAN